MNKTKQKQDQCCEIMIDNRMILANECGLCGPKENEFVYILVWRIEIDLEIQW